MSPSAIPTHDGNWIARCPASGKTASGQSRDASLVNLRTLIERDAA
ncbi:hypothetical protein [Ochrobactrum sp. CGA5]|nr:hypothetical protein [Ochrobactrum sp. CGA5]